MNRNSGFASVLLVLLVAAFLLVTSVLGFTRTYLVQSSLAGEHAYRIARLAAYDCAILAFSALKNDSDRFVNDSRTEIRSSESSKCTVRAASTTEESMGVVVWGTSGSSSVAAYVTANHASTSPFELTVWREDDVYFKEY